MKVGHHHPWLSAATASGPSGILLDTAHPGLHHRPDTARPRCLPAPWSRKAPTKLAAVDAEDHDPQRVVYLGRRAISREALSSLVQRIRTDRTSCRSTAALQTTRPCAPPSSSPARRERPMRYAPAPAMEGKSEERSALSTSRPVGPPRTKRVSRPVQDDGPEESAVIECGKPTREARQSS